MHEKVVGIIGGMGPEATVDLMVRVIKATHAFDDIDHVRLVVDSNPKVPSRIKALIEKTGESPLPCLQEMARKLAAWGVDFLAIPCNTAHFYHPGIQAAVAIPVLNMIDLAVERVSSENPGLETVGLLASTAVLDLRLYEKRFAEKGASLISPTDSLQREVMAAIRKIKTSNYGQEVVAVIQAAADDMVGRGARALLVACTELSIISHQLKTEIACHDAAQILAEAIVQYAQNQTGGV
jgi:aspartate racemase